TAAATPRRSSPPWRTAWPVSRSSPPHCTGWRT
ncbi:MAG: hypothetical protein AVDCRST_MAG33-3244, partial [uncultured Thermomicrobiales bacterium]